MSRRGGLAILGMRPTIEIFSTLFHRAHEIALERSKLELSSAEYLTHKQVTCSNILKSGEP